MNTSLSFALLASAALFACQDKPSAEGHPKREPRSAELPYLTADNGTRIPYFEYTNGEFSLGGNSESELAVFVYPIFSGRRSEGLALPHAPTQDVAELFGEELFGRNFSVAVTGGVLSIDEIPVSRPIDLNPRSKWKMTYGGAAFDCRVTRQVGADFTIRCDSNRIELNLRFNMDRGITSYQDYCRKDLCTYNLKSSVGILSPYHLRVLTEPQPIVK